MAEIREALNKVIVNLGSGRCIAHNEPFARQVMPVEFPLTAMGMIAWEDDKYPFGP